MDYYYSNIKNRKILRILFKTSVFSVLTCFLALFAGLVSGNKVAVVKDDKGFEGRVILTGDYDKNVQILKDDNKVKLQANDEVSFAANGHEQTCYIRRAIPVELEVDGVARYVNSKPGISVAQSLQEAVLNLSDDDVITIEKPGVETKFEKDGGLNRNIEVENGLKVIVNKANFNTRIAETEIDYTIEEKLDENLEEGARRIEVKGEKGLMRTELQDKIINNRVVETKQISEPVVVKEPKKEVVVKGTKRLKRWHNSGANGKQSNHKANRHAKSVNEPNTATKRPGSSGVISGYATSYNVGSRTSLGAKPKSGTIAGDPNVIPYKSHVVVRNKKNGKVIYEGVMGDYCPTAVKKKRGVVVDLYGANIGRVPVTVEWSKQ